MTVEEFLALNPGQRLQFARGLGTKLTPEVVALVVYTYLTTEMSTPVRQIYGSALRELAAQVDPIALHVLAYQFINTSTATPALLPVHQGMNTVFAELRGDLVLRYIRQESGPRGVTFFTGSLSRRIVPSNLVKLVADGLKKGDGVLYDLRDIRRACYGAPNSVPMVRVPMDMALPATLGL